MPRDKRKRGCYPAFCAEHKGKGLDAVRLVKKFKECDAQEAQRLKRKWSGQLELSPYSRFCATMKGSGLSGTELVERFKAQQDATPVEGTVHQGPIGVQVGKLTFSPSRIAALRNLKTRHDLKSSRKTGYKYIVRDERERHSHRPFTYYITIGPRRHYRSKYYATPLLAADALLEQIRAWLKKIDAIATTPVEREEEALKHPNLLARTAANETPEPPNVWPPQGAKIFVRVAGTNIVWAPSIVQEVYVDGRFKVRVHTKPDSWDDYLALRDEGSLWKRDTVQCPICKRGKGICNKLDFVGHLQSGGDVGLSAGQPRACDPSRKGSCFAEQDGEEELDDEEVEVVEAVEIEEDVGVKVGVGCVVQVVADDDEDGEETSSSEEEDEDDVDYEPEEGDDESESQEDDLQRSRDTVSGDPLQHFVAWLAVPPSSQHDDGDGCGELHLTPPELYSRYKAFCDESGAVALDRQAFLAALGNNTLPHFVAWLAIAPSSQHHDDDDGGGDLLFTPFELYSRYKAFCGESGAAALGRQAFLTALGSEKFSGVTRRGMYDHRLKKSVRKWSFDLATLRAKHVRREARPGSPREHEIRSFEGGELARVEFKQGSPREYEIDFYEGDEIVRTEFKAGSPNEHEIRFYEAGKNVRTEFKAGSPREHEICFHEDGEHVRTEWKPGSPREHTIGFIEGGKVVRIEYKPGSPREHEIRFFEAGKVVRTEFKAGSPREHEICFFEDGKHVRTEFKAGSPREHEICFFEAGEHVRTEFKAGSPREHEIRFFEAGKVVRIEFKAGSPREHAIGFFEGGKVVRIEYKPGSPREHEIRFFEAGKVVRTEFKPGSPREHEICFHEDGEHVRIEFKAGSPHEHEIDFYEGGELVRTEFKPGSNAESADGLAQLGHASIWHSQLLYCRTGPIRAGSRARRPARADLSTDGTQIDDDNEADAVAPARTDLVVEDSTDHHDEVLQALSEIRKVCATILAPSPTRAD